MPIMEWQETFRIGISQFDDHHQHLVGLLNSTYDRFIKEGPPQDLYALLNSLADYADYHFKAEEQWMLANNYPFLDKHASEHIGFKARVAEMHRDYEEEKETVMGILIFLVDWLSDHILITDADLGRFSRPCSPPPGEQT